MANTTKKAAAKKQDSLEALRKAVEAARKDGYDVKVSVSKIDDEGVSQSERL